MGEVGVDGPLGGLGLVYGHIAGAAGVAGVEASGGEAGGGRRRVRRADASRDGSFRLFMIGIKTRDELVKVGKVHMR